MPVEWSQVLQLEELNCSICQERYGNFSLCPRMLVCGHTFCSGCLKFVIKERPFCPDCREPIVEKNVEKMPTCYIVKQIIESIDALNQMQEANTPSDDCNESEDRSIIQLYNTSDPFPSVGTCPVHRSPQQFWCVSCTFWICGACAYLNHSKDEIVLAVKHFESLKANQNKLIGDQLIELQNAIETIGNIADLVREERNVVKQVPGNPAIISYDVSLLEIYNNILKNLMKKRKELENSLEIVSNLKEKLNIESLKELHMASKFVNNLWSRQCYPQEEGQLIEGIFTNIINQVPQFLIKINGMAVSLRRDGKQLFAPIKFENDFMIIPSLKEGPTDAVHSVPFQELKKKSKHTKAFFRLSRQGTKLGTVEMKIFDNKRSDQFIMLCTGEKGPSYKWTKFFASGGLFTQFLAGGDYEKNNGEGGAQVLENIGDPYGIRMEDGIVCGEISFHKKQLAQFKIFYKVGSSPFAHCPIGLVTKGLDLIKNIAQQDYKRVYIEECGIMVPIHDDYCSNNH